MISGDAVITGQVTGTGAVLNVEVGFKPNYVKVFNPNDAGSLFPTIEWFYGMTAAYGLKTKVIADNGTTSNKSQDLITSNGISQFAGEAPNKVLTGTIAATAASATLTGTSTAFLVELKVGDTIKLYDGQELVVSAIASATSLTVATAATASVATNKATRKNGRSEGFTIGADADLNASGEVINYLVVR